MKIVTDLTPQGNVEAWLGLLLDGVKETIHNIIRQAHMAIGDQGFKLVEFQSMFPAQVGLLGIQFIWTRDAEEALRHSKSDKKVQTLSLLWVFMQCLKWDGKDHPISNLRSTGTFFPLQALVSCHN